MKTKLIAIGLSLFGISSVFFFQNCAGKGFNALDGDVELASMDTSNSLFGAGKRGQTNRPEDLRLINVSTFAPQSCQQFLQNSSFNNPSEFVISMVGNESLPGGVLHPRDTAVLTTLSGQMKSLNGMEFKLQAWNMFGQETPVQVDYSNRGYFKLNWNHTQLYGRDKQAVTYQVTALCDGLVLAASNKLTYQHIPECWTGVSLNPQITEVSANDTALGANPKVDTSLSNAQAASFIQSIATADIRLNQVEYKCNNASAGIQLSYELPGRMRAGNVVAFDSRIVRNDALTSNVRACRTDIIATGGIVAVYKNSAGKPVCVSEKFRKSYKIPMSTSSPGGSSGGSSSGSTSGGSSGTTGGSTGDTDPAPQTTPQCEFAGAQDPDSPCTFTSLKASLGQRIGASAVAPKVGYLYAKCDGGGKWSQVSVTCEMQPNATGAECEFPGGTDPSGQCSYPSFRAKSGWRHSVYSVSGVLGRVVGTCDNGTFKDIQWSCDSK